MHSPPSAPVGRYLNSPRSADAREPAHAPNAFPWRLAWRLAVRWMLRMTPLTLWVALLAAGTSRAQTTDTPGNGSEGKNPATTDAPAPDKSAYTLFRPTPSKLLRDLSTDRPDITESPITVDAGHFQLELSFLEYGRDRQAGTKTDEFDVLPFNLKVGLLDNVDLQLVFLPYANVRTKVNARVGGAASSHLDGTGDFQTRLKINFWGNEGPTPTFGNTSFGFMPFLQAPTSGRGLGSDHVEGGLIFPFDMELPGKFDFGAMAEFDFLWNDDRRRYGVEFLHSATLHHSVVAQLSGYVEYAGVAPSGTGSPYRATFSGGLIYQMGKNMQFDAGALVGLNHAAEDLRLFTGFSVRH